MKSAFCSLLTDLASTNRVRTRTHIYTSEIQRSITTSTGTSVHTQWEG